MSRNYPATLSIFMVLLFSSCGTEQTSNSSDTLSGKMVITGSSTIAPLASELAKKFEKLHPAVKIDVQAGGSSRGIADVKRTVSQIGMVSRKLNDSESDLASQVLGKDGVAIIVHKDNPLTSLTSDQVRAIFTDKIKTWNPLNGNEEKIIVINKAEGRSTLEVFLTFFALSNRTIKPDIIIGDNEQGIKLVANNRNAIAYVSIGTAEYSSHLGVKIKTLALDGIAATTKNLANGSFPLSRELNLITFGTRSKIATLFLNYVRSPAAQSTIEEFGFVPVNTR